jgi:hypothetical protein
MWMRIKKMQIMSQLRSLDLEPLMELCQVLTYSLALEYDTDWLR